MRGGAIPVAAWGTLLLVLFIGNAVWNAKPVNAAAAGFAAVVIYAVAVALWLANRDAARRGPPEPRESSEAVPQASFGAVIAGVALAAILFGIVWAKFLVYFGAAILVAGLGRLAQELRAERLTSRQVAAEARGPAEAHAEHRGEGTPR